MLLLWIRVEAETIEAKKLFHNLQNHGPFILRPHSQMQFKVLPRTNRVKVHLWSLATFISTVE